MPEYDPTWDREPIPSSRKGPHFSGSNGGHEASPDRPSNKHPRNPQPRLRRESPNPFRKRSQGKKKISKIRRYLSPPITHPRPSVLDSLCIARSCTFEPSSASHSRHSLPSIGMARLPRADCRSCDKPTHQCKSHQLASDRTHLPRVRIRGPIARFRR
jgi:hypothetical protein